MLAPFLVSPLLSLAVAVFSAHMALGIWWNRVFFGLKRIAQSVVWMLLFWLSICASIGALHRVRPAAGALMAPTIGWVTVATALNVALWRMNAGGVPDLTAEERAAYRKEKEEGGRQKRA